MITINKDKAKQDTHNVRKDHRSVAMREFDAKIAINETRINYMADGPEKDALIAENQASEVERQKIREANAITQSEIDTTDDIDTLAKIKNGMVLEIQALSLKQ